MRIQQKVAIDRVRSVRVVHNLLLSLKHGGRWGITYVYTTSFLLFFSVLYCPLGLGELQACPFPDVVLTPPFLSALSSPPPPSLFLARRFWPDLMNRRHVHSTSVCVSLRCSRGLRVIRLLAESWQRFPRWQHGHCMRCVVSHSSTSFPWLVFFSAALLRWSMIRKHTGRYM